MFVATELARIPSDNFKRVKNTMCEILETLRETDTRIKLVSRTLRFG